MDSPWIEVATPWAPALAKFWVSLSWASGLAAGLLRDFERHAEVLRRRLRAVDDLLDERIALGVGDEAEGDVLGRGAHRAEPERAGGEHRCLEKRIQFHASVPPIPLVVIRSGRLRRTGSTSRERPHTAVSPPSTTTKEPVM